MLLYSETIPEGEDIVIEDWPLEQLIKEKKKKGDKLPSPKMIWTGSKNPVPIVPAGLVRLIQIPVDSVPALPASKVDSS